VNSEFKKKKTEKNNIRKKHNIDKLMKERKNISKPPLNFKKRKKDPERSSPSNFIECQQFNIMKKFL